LAKSPILSPVLRSACPTSPTLRRIMYKVKGDGPGVHFNIGLSDTEKAELDSITLEALIAMYKKEFVRSFSYGASLYRGVAWRKDCQKWTASIKVDGKQKNLGVYLIEEDAALAFDNASKEIHGR
jgi:hypothetical protein